MRNVLEVNLLQGLRGCDDLQWFAILSPPWFDINLDSIRPEHLINIILWIPKRFQVFLFQNKSSFGFFNT